MLSDEEISADVAEYRAVELFYTNAIYEKSKLYLGVSFLAIISYVAAAVGADWVQWVAGFFIAGLLAGQFGMLGLLRRLQLFYAPYPNYVVQRHLLLGIAAFLLLIYSLIGMWMSWPVPWLAMLLAIIVNTLHGIGYAPKN